MATISLCMIVRNEEKLLPQCLESVNAFVDEIIIVDTGSNDGTIEIAERFGAKVYRHPWEGNFSTHRNQSISYASSEWIFIMDADEELKRESGSIIQEAVSEKDIDSVMGVTINFFNKRSSKALLYQVRLFKNNQNIYYQGSVHNQLKGLRYTKKYPIYIYHYGYDLEKEILKKKHIRTTELIKKQIEKEPNNYFHHLNLSVCYSTNFQFKEAIDEGISAMQLANNQGMKDPNVLWGYYIVSSAYLKLDDLYNAGKYALKAINLFPDHLDSYFVLTLVYHAQKNWVKLLEASHEFLRVLSLLDISPERFASSIINMANEEWRIHIALGDMYLHQNDMENAGKEFGIARALTPVPGDCHRMTGDCHRNAGLWQPAQVHYELALKEQPGDAEAIFGLALAYKNLNNQEMCKELIGKIKESEIDRTDIFFEKGIIDLKDKRYDSAIKYFNNAIKLKSDFYPAYLNLALAYKYRGKLQQALEVNLKALKLKPESTDTRINLGHLYYEMKEFDPAKEMFESVLSLDPDLVDIRILLCEIHLMAGDVENCVHECDGVLKTLGIPRNMTLNSLSDMAGLFFLIGQVLATSGKIMLSEKAMKIAHQLDSQIEEKLRAMNSEPGKR